VNQNPDDVLALVRERLSEFLKRPLTDADLDQAYAELGADSMDMVVLAFELEKMIGRPVLPELFLQHDTIRGALDVILADRFGLADAS
jgi:acyl carrier protein